MKKLLLINSVINSGSTGRIAEEIGVLASQNGFESYTASGNPVIDSSLKSIRIGNGTDVSLHVIATRLFDYHGFASSRATTKFIDELEKNLPDIVHLHNIHGYFLQVELLFDFLKTKNIPVIWTFHDCWPFTGHCSYFDRYQCMKWRTECKACPNKAGYPASYFDFSTRNFYRKMKAFTGHSNLTVVTPSNWLKHHVEKSFLRSYPVKVINNGVNTEIFKQVDADAVRMKYQLNNFSKIILGVASTWDKRKGFADFVELAGLLPDNYRIVLVGLSDKQLNELPENITGIKRTENVHELAALYSLADVFVNPTYIDNFPTTNIEALACGTPVVTYNTGGSPEAVDGDTGVVVDQGNLPMLYKSVTDILNAGKNLLTEKCRNRATLCYDKNHKFMEYIDLYRNVLNFNDDK